MQKVHWQNYHDVYPPHHLVSGIIKVGQHIHSPQLGNWRDVLVYLPPSYFKNENRRYPVLYMQDGQNLFDAETSYAGEWHVDETMEQLGREEGQEAIVVGIPNAGAQRLAEYTPFPDPEFGGGQGDRYLAFVVQTIKPLIDGAFRTLPNRQHTGIVGSSLGGLISLYAFFRYPDVFGFAGVMSPSLWVGDGAIYRFLEEAPYRPGKIYLDAGTREYGGVHDGPDSVERARSRRYYATVRRVKRILVHKGYRPFRDLLHIEEPLGQHHEAAWARRLPELVRFFLTDRQRIRLPEVGKL